MIFPILIIITFIGGLTILIQDIKNNNAYFTKLTKTHKEFVELWEYAMNHNLDKMEGVTYNNRFNSEKGNYMKFHNGKIDFPVNTTNKRIALDAYYPLMELKRAYNNVRLKGDLELEERKKFMREFVDKLKKDFENDLKPYIREKRLNQLLD